MRRRPAEHVLMDLGEAPRPRSRLRLPPMRPIPSPAAIELYSSDGVLQLLLGDDWARRAPALARGPSAGGSGGLLFPESEPGWQWRREGFAISSTASRTGRGDCDETQHAYHALRMPILAAQAAAVDGHTPAVASNSRVPRPLCSSNHTRRPPPSPPRPAPTALASEISMARVAHGLLYRQPPISTHSAKPRSSFIHQDRLQQLGGRPDRLNPGAA